MSAIRPDFFKIIPDEIARYGINSAYLLALVRFATNVKDERNGRVLIDGEIWWRASQADIVESLVGSMDRYAVMRTVRKLEKAGMLLSCFPSGSEDRTKAYRVPDQPLCENAHTPTSHCAESNGATSHCAKTHGPMCENAQCTTSFKEPKEQNTPTSCSGGGSRRTPESNGSESAATANTSADACPGVFEEPTTQGEEPMHDPNQDGLPGLLISLPTNRTPEPVPDTAPAKVSRTERERGRKTRMPEGWTPSPDTDAKMRAKYPDLNHEAIFEHWCDKAAANGYRHIDWDAAWRSWLAIENAKSNPVGGRRRNGRAISATDRRVAEIQALKRNTPGMRALP